MVWLNSSQDTMGEGHFTADGGLERLAQVLKELGMVRKYTWGQFWSEAIVCSCGKTLCWYLQARQGLFWLSAQGYSPSLQGAGWGQDGGSERLPVTWQPQSGSREKWMPELSSLLLLIWSWTPWGLALKI